MIGPERARWTLLLSHGAGASTSSHFFSEFSTRLIERGKEIGGIRIASFDFPYMQKTILTGRRHLPDPIVILMKAYLEAIVSLNVEPDHLIIGGKSMGARVASMIAEESNVAALVCLGYPFHPRGKPEKLRTAHLEDLSLPTLICQGTRDALGSLEDTKGYHLSSAIQFSWLPDGDHDFVPRKRSGYTLNENLNTAVSSVVNFTCSLA
jgi:predicted alpha/beta-hydrolase family hydrolase